MKKSSKQQLAYEKSSQQIVKGHDARTIGVSNKYWTSKRILNSEPTSCIIMKNMTAT